MADRGTRLCDEAFRDRLEQRLIGLTEQLLGSGTDVIVEFGSWVRSERNRLLAVGRRAEPGQTVIHRTTFAGLRAAAAAADRRGARRIGRRL